MDATWTGRRPNGRPVDAQVWKLPGSMLYLECVWTRPGLDGTKMECELLSAECPDDEADPDIDQGCAIRVVDSMGRFPHRPIGQCDQA